MGIEEILQKASNLVITGLKVAASAIYARVMSFMGLSWVTFNQAMPEVKSWLADQASSLPTQATDFLGACGIDIFMVLVISAIASQIGWKVMLVATEKLAELQGNAGGG
ncbi:DUF2523 domain-containing protein [Lysobacter sp. A6]|uniref:DUF2523 domain-containing protein n=1 Tax=Noviluteimonas lactosilytica TaxID=2888523 RepID=A0ABS8JI19_9GAMM|nr:DUF2523 family protein [Lysobacter lactosilyticus]MCC8363254.1 DUF2523 domain-containing protein [Lysobacter lactosilyticus]